MQVTTSVAIMQVLRPYCSYADSTFCYSYFGGSFCYNHPCDCFCCNHAVRSFCSTYASDSSCIEYVGDNFCIYSGGSICCKYASVLSVVHNCFYYKMPLTVSVIAMQVTLSSNSFTFLSLTGTHFSKN